MVGNNISSLSKDIMDQWPHHIRPIINPYYEISDQNVQKFGPKFKDYRTIKSKRADIPIIL
jgi:hypothetical protein